MRVPVMGAILRGRPSGEPDAGGAASPAGPEATAAPRPRRALARLRALATLACALAVALCALWPTQALAKSGHWALADRNLVSQERQVNTYHWVDDATRVDLYVSTGRDAYRLVRSGRPEEMADLSPATAPQDGQGWTVSAATTATAPGGNTDSILGAWDAQSGTFTAEAPGWTEPGNAIVHLICSLAAGLVMWILRLGVTVMQAVDVQSLLLADVSGGTWASFYTLSTTIATKVATPLGSAFVTLWFVVQVIRLTDSRRYGGRAWFESLLRLVVFYLVAATLVANSMVVMEAVYWVGRQLAASVAAVMGAGSLTFVGEGLVTTFAAQFASVTYDDWVVVLVMAVLAILPIKNIFTFSITVFSTCFLRMVEIYLRAAFAAIPLSFVVADDTRQIALSYLRRFAGCCFMGAVFVAALGLSGSLAETVREVFEPMMSVATGPQLALATVAPVVITLISLDSIIKKSSDIANSIFGM